MAPPSGETGGTALKVKAVDNHGLTGLMEIEVKIFANTCTLITPNSEWKQSLCAGDSLMLMSEASTGSETVRWLHNDGTGWAAVPDATTFRLWVKEAGLYVAEWTFSNAATCTTVVDTVVVDTLKFRTRILINTNGESEQPKAICEVLSGVKPYSFSWINKDGCLGDINCDSIYLDSLNNYTIVTVTDSLGCIAFDTASNEFFGQVLRPLSSIDEPSPCTLTGANLFCNGSLEDPVDDPGPYGGTGSNLNKIKYWGWNLSSNTGFARGGYLSSSGIPGFDMPDDIEIQRTAISSVLVNPPTGGGDRIIYLQANMNRFEQKLQSNLRKDVKHVISFQMRRSERSYRARKTVWFSFPPNELGQQPITMGRGQGTTWVGSDEWKREQMVFTVPSSNPLNFSRFALMPSGNYPAIGEDNIAYWWTSSGLETDTWCQYFYDLFFLAEFPAIKCAIAYKEKDTPITLGLDKASGWITDFQAHTGATFAWTPTTDLEGENTATPTANPKSDITYTCTMTLNGTPYTIGTTAVKALGTNDILFSGDACDGEVTVSSTFPTGAELLWTLPNSTTSTSTGFNIDYPLGSNHALNVAVTDPCTEEPIIIETMIPGSGLNNDDPVNLGINPRHCCAEEATFTQDVTCMSNGGNSKQDYYLKFTLNRYCTKFPSLYISSDDGSFPVTTTIQYKVGSTTYDLDPITSGANGDIYEYSSEEMGSQPGIVSASPAVQSVPFTVHLESKSTGVTTGNFVFKISSVEVNEYGSGEDRQVCDDRFLACCRKAVDGSSDEADKSSLAKQPVLKIRPNPASGNVKFTLEKIGSWPVDLEIRDALGRLVKHIQTSGKEYNLDTSEIPNGFYQVDVVSQNGKITGQRLIISR